MKLANTRWLITSSTHHAKYGATEKKKVFRFLDETRFDFTISDHYKDEYDCRYSGAYGVVDDIINLHFDADSKGVETQDRLHILDASTSNILKLEHLWRPGAGQLAKRIFYIEGIDEHV